MRLKCRGEAGHSRECGVVGGRRSPVIFIPCGFCAPVAAATAAAACCACYHLQKGGDGGAVKSDGAAAAAAEQ
jgi:hypothetical protein